MSKFIQIYEEVMKTCGVTFRTDPMGKRVAVPPQGTYKCGRNGNGVGIAKGSTAKEDDVGQYHEIPPGHELKIGKSGKGKVVCKGQRTTEKNGQIQVTDTK